MAIESFTDEQIHDLLVMQKSVINPNAKGIVECKHLKTNYKVVGPEGATFILYLRQHQIIEDHFSCGLRWTTPSGDTLTLVRYNGSSHSHPNKIEKMRLGYVCHIHRATQRYIAAGKKPDGYAEATLRYQTLAGALHCLTQDCRISGIQTKSDELPLFP